MIPASALELGMLWVMTSSHEMRTRIVGALFWIAYFRFSASRAALAELARWLYDRNNPPPGAA